MLLKWDGTMKVWAAYWMKDREPMVANEGFQLIVSDLKDTYCHSAASSRERGTNLIGIRVARPEKIILIRRM